MLIKFKQKNGKEKIISSKNTPIAIIFQSDLELSSVLKEAKSLGKGEEYRFFFNSGEKMDKDDIKEFMTVPTDPKHSA